MGLTAEDSLPIALPAVGGIMPFLKGGPGGHIPVSTTKNSRETIINIFTELKESLIW